MIYSLSLQNFKSFCNLDTLSIKPLTILCGANSSGKSTILKSILTLKQSFSGSKTYDTLILNGELVNNGFFEDVAHNGCGDFFTISQSFFIKRPFDKKGKMISRTVNVQTYKALRKIFLETREYPSSFNIDLSVTFRKNTNSTFNHMPSIYEYILTITTQTCEQTIVSTVKLKRNIDDTFALTWINVPDVNHKMLTGEAKQCVAYFYDLQLGNAYVNAGSITSESNIVEVTAVLSNIYTLCKIAADQYQSISFLGPLRQSPARAYTYTNEIFSIGTMGEYTPFVLAQNKNKVINVAIPTTKNAKIVFQDEKMTLLEATQFWLNYMGVKPIDISQNSELIKLTIGNSNIADVGFGISQLLPIIVEGLSILPEQTLILEQPEIHLHPSLQMKLIDFVISLVKKGKQVILETHSDHIINRLTRRIMEEENTFLLNSSIIYYVEQVTDESKIDSIKLDKIHGIAECPEEFFSQYSSEVDLIVQTGFSNIQKRSIQNEPN